MEKIINNRKFRLLLACISLLILVDQVQDTYAKYVSSAEATTNFTIARWAFTINTQDVIANSNFTNTITPVFDANSHIANNVIAPTSSGYITVAIDSSNVGVSFDQTITLSSAIGNTVTDLTFTGYKKGINGTFIPFTNNQTSLTETFLLGNNSPSNTYYFYFEWEDGAGETMDNADDTDAAINGLAAITVNVNFIQRAEDVEQNQGGEGNGEGGDDPGNDPGD